MTARLARCATLTTVVAGIFFGALAPLAQAVPNGKLQCRATAIKVADDDGSNATSVQVANERANPCRTDTPATRASGETPSNGNGQASGRLLDAQTELRPANFESKIPASGDGASANAAVGEVTVTSGANVVRARVIYSIADITCTAGIPVLTGASEVQGLTINGDSQSLDPGTHQEFPLGGGGTLHVNEKTQTSSSLIQTALILEGQFGSVRIAEAGVSYTGSPCVDTEPPTPLPRPARFDCTGVPMILSRGALLSVNPVAPFAANADSVGCPNEEGFGADARFVNGDIHTVALRGETWRDPSEAVLATPLPLGSQAHAAARAGTADLLLGNTRINAKGMVSRVDATCGVLGAVTYAGSSQVNDLMINGNPTIVGTNEQIIPLSIGTLYLNRRISTGGSEARYPFWLISPQFGNVIMGASVVRTYKQPCA